MNTTEIITIVTIIITWILGFIAKKSKYVSNNLIPIQNIAVGVIVAIIQFIITKDFELSITVSGIFAGGIYDIGHNFAKLMNEKKEDDK